MPVPILSCEEREALIRYMWGIERGKDGEYVDSAVAKKRFNICAYCQLHPSLACETHGCYLLKGKKVDILNRGGK